MISVSVASPDSLSTEQWDALSRHSSNVFMNPVALQAASSTMMAVISVLVAWDVGVEPARLVGMWALQAKNALPFMPSFLEALPFPYAFLSTPVVMPERAAEVIPAFFAAMARDPKLPSVVWMEDIDAEGPVFDAMEKTIAAGGLQQLEIKSSERPIVTREFGQKLSGSTRKKLRQDWNRLGAQGEVAVVNCSTQPNVIAALEVFLKLEMASWKGQQGTALLSDARDAAFTRKLISDLAANGDATVALLTLDGKPIAAQVLLYSGRTAYTWKTAFDAEFSKFSPGALLVDKITEQLFAGERIDTIDSCSVEDGFMGRLWAGRKKIANMLVSAAPGRSTAFAMQSAQRKGYEMLRNLRDKFRDRGILPGAKPAASSQRNTA